MSVADMSDRALDRATRSRNTVAIRLRTAGAVTRETATRILPEGKRETKLLDRMVAFGAVKETPEGSHWLDERRFLDFRKEGLASVLGYIAIAGFAAAGALAATG